jgi:hypothetical protein
MPSNITYQEELKQKQTIKLRELLGLLPAFCREFFIGIEPTTSIRTRLAYAYDLNMFFNYLCGFTEHFKILSVHSITATPARVQAQSPDYRFSGRSAGRCGHHTEMGLTGNGAGPQYLSLIQRRFLIEASSS